MSRFRHQRLRSNKWKQQLPTRSVSNKNNYHLIPFSSWCLGFFRNLTRISWIFNLKVRVSKVSFNIETHGSGKKKTLQIYSQKHMDLRSLLNFPANRKSTIYTWTIHDAASHPICSHWSFMISHRYMKIQPSFPNVNAQQILNNQSFTRRAFGRRTT